MPQPTAVCPVCRGTADSLGAINVITPFWIRIPRFFAFPANLGALLYIFILAIISSVTFSLSLLGMLMQLVVFAVFLRYAYAVLSHTASGYLTPPRIDFDMVNQDLARPFKQLAVFLFLGVVSNLLYAYVGIWVAWIYWLGMTLCIPATAMVIAINNSFWRAVNPIALMGIVRRIGWPYLILCVFLYILWGGSGILAAMVGGRVSFEIAFFIYDLASMYFLLVMFHMMGYVIYQYHEQLGFAVEVPIEEHGAANAARARPGNPAVREADILVKEGKTEVAITRLKEWTARQPTDLEAREKLQALAHLTHNTALLVEQAPNLIATLLAADRRKAAADVFLDTATVQPGFQPAQATDFNPLATQLESMRRYPAVLSLLSGFAKRFPGHADIPALYYLGARILCEQFKQDKKAATILTGLLAKYPQHELVPAIQKYLATVNQLSA
ncbi:MAG: tetratricopeptide repeat protein [Sulfuricaulis sp.]